MITMNWTVSLKGIEMTFVVIWRFINKTELNLIGFCDHSPYENVQSLKEGLQVLSHLCCPVLI